jgi:hypothetical protein
MSLTQLHSSYAAEKEDGSGNLSTDALVACSAVMSQILPERTGETLSCLGQGVIESLDQESDPGLPNTEQECKDVVLKSQSTPSQPISSIAFDAIVLKVVS